MNCFTARSLGYLSNGQLQGKLLSAYKISQALPGTPPQGAKEITTKCMGRFVKGCACSFAPLGLARIRLECHPPLTRWATILRSLRELTMLSR